jgi:hypothetical protein
MASESSDRIQPETAARRQNEDSTGGAAEEVPADLMRLQAHGFDLMAHVEAFLRYVRKAQQHTATLKEHPSPAARAQALPSLLSYRR